MNEEKPIKINRINSLQEIEDHVNEINNKYSQKLRLPASLHSSGALGVEVSIVQLIGTWIRSHVSESIFHSYQENTSESFSKLCQSLYGLAVLSMAGKTISTTGEPVTKRKSLQSAIEIFNNLREKKYDKCFKGHYIGIPSIKTDTYNREFETPLYNGESVISSDAFKKQIMNIVDKKIGTKGRVESLKSKISIDDLSELLWELFKNTHDHGRIDKKLNLLSPNFRAILLQTQDIDDNYLGLWCGKSPSRKQLSLKENWTGRKEKHHILDISIVDLGAGLFELSKEKANNPDSEDGRMDTVAKCFEDGWSRLNKSNRGSGLTKILHCIHKYNGWLRVRTDNVLIEKTFSKDTTPEITKDDIRIVESRVSGTTFNIAIPINISSTEKGFV